MSRIQCKHRNSRSKSILRLAHFHQIERRRIHSVTVTDERCIFVEEQVHSQSVIRRERPVTFYDCIRATSVRLRARMSVVISQARILIPVAVASGAIIVTPALRSVRIYVGRVLVVAASAGRMRAIVGTSESIDDDLCWSAMRHRSRNSTKAVHAQLTTRGSDRGNDGNYRPKLKRRTVAG